MRISVSGMKKSRKIELAPLTASRGFSLVEILVVLFILGMAIAMAALSLRTGSDSELNRETEHFVLSARFVSEQATLNQEIVGMFVAPVQAQGSAAVRWCYEWRRFQEQSWQPVTDYLERHCLPDELQLEMMVEGERYEYDPRETTPRPVLVFYPSGEASAFEMALSPDGFNVSDEEVQRVEVDMVGRIRWRNLEEERERERAQW